MHRLLITIGIALLLTSNAFATTYTVTMQPDLTFYPRSITIAAGDTELASGFSLPAGSRITGMEVDGCDTDMSAQIVSKLVRIAESGNNTATVLAQSVQLQLTNCTYSSSGPLTEVVDNLGYSYLVDVTLQGGATQFRTVRIYYNTAAVSLGPATPTFTDVSPSHLFY